MYIRITKDAIDQIKADAIVRVEKKTKKMDEGFIQGIRKSEGRHIIDVKVPGVEEGFRKALFSVIREADKHKFKSIAIPVLPDTYLIQDDVIPGLLAEVFNEEAAVHLLNILLKPNDDCLNEIILVVDSKQMCNSIAHKLKITKNWPKARKLGFVLDALDLNLNQTALCKRDFISGKYFKRHLADFSKECHGELIQRESKLAAKVYGEDVRKPTEIINRMSELSDMLSDSTIREYYRNEMYIDETDIKRFLEVIEQLPFGIHQLFPYIKHLVPDEKWRRIRPGTGKRDGYVVERKKEIKSEHQDLKKKIRKTRQLKNTVFPVHLLERFWDEATWKAIISDVTNNSEIATGLLMKLYDAAKDTIEDAKSRKKKP